VRVTGDPVVAALSEVAAVMFPTVYTPDIQVGPTYLPNPEVIRQIYVDENADAAYARAVDAIGCDPALAPLLGQGEQHGSWLSGAIISSDVGRSWLIQSRTFLPGTFVQNAARLAVAKGLPTDSLEPLLGELGPLVLSVRRLVAGGSDEVPVLMAFHGIGIAEGARLATPWGLLRPPFPSERKQRPFGSLSPSAILETTLPLRWKLGEHDASISEEFTAVGTHRDLLALTALLALGRSTPLHWLWQATLVPLQAPGNEYVGGAMGPSWSEPPAPDPLAEEQANGLVVWADRVARFYHPSIAVAMRRTLSAVAERNSSAEDTLIDAVIAWENLFGTGGTSEMTFRVTTALALLLEPDPTSRPALRKELSKVYDLRSKVAHGGEVKSKDHLDARKDRAIDVAIEALRALFEMHPSLLSEPERGMRLILDLPGND
jgi:Apea-like HEPN